MRESFKVQHELGPVSTMATVEWREKGRAQQVLNSVHRALYGSHSTAEPERTGGPLQSGSLLGLEQYWSLGRVFTLSYTDGHRSNWSPLYRRIRTQSRRYLVSCVPVISTLLWVVAFGNISFGFGHYI